MDDLSPLEATAVQWLRLDIACDASPLPAIALNRDTKAAVAVVLLDDGTRLDVAGLGIVAELALSDGSWLSIPCELADDGSARFLVDTEDIYPHRILFAYLRVSGDGVQMQSTSRFLVKITD